MGVRGQSARTSSRPRRSLGNDRHQHRLRLPPPVLNKAPTGCEISGLVSRISEVNPKYFAYEASLLHGNPAAEHEALLQNHEDYRALTGLFSILSSTAPEPNINDEQLALYSPHLQTLAKQFPASNALLQNWSKLHPGSTGGEAAQRMRDRLLLSDLHRRELAWRLRYFQGFNAMATWVKDLQEPTLNDKIDAFGTIRQEEVSDELKKRRQAQVRQRVKRHREKKAG